MKTLVKCSFTMYTPGIQAYLKKLYFFLLGSAAHKKLKEILTRPRLLTAIEKLSDYHQTSSLEAKHALDNQFASKKNYYPYHSLMVRCNILIKINYT